ncbi:MAG: cytochrome b/b6 domain-containing protein [Rhodobacter sp.]|jgi:cytochrome b561|nr:cytochrome b/b6 domain-containing protein [Rhodobacter sp.]
MTHPTGYSRLQIWLHWLIAILIAATWFTHEDMGRALRTRLDAGATGIEGNTLHVWLGGAAFALVAIRIVVRLVQGAPAAVPGANPLLDQAALWGHRLLYLLMIAAPALGAVAWYGGLKSAGEIHEIAANALVIVALGHAGVAIWHHAVLKDGVLTRMIRPRH